MMTEQRTVFGEVLAELMHSRGIEDTAEKVTELAERADLDPQTVMEWMRDKSRRRDSDLDGLARALDLSDTERLKLAMAYALEERSNEETGNFYVEPTIIRRQIGDREQVASVASENALVVFRSEEEAEKFRAYSGLYPDSEGYELAYLDLLDIARTCVQHGLYKVCMPEPWAGESGVDFFTVEAFIELLRGSDEA